MSEKLTRLRELIDEISMGPFGSDIKVENFVPFGVPVLNGSNVDGVRLTEQAFKYVSEEKAKTYRKAVARRGDIVVTHRGTLGQISFIPEDSKFDGYVISQSQFRVRLKADKAIPSFFVYYFHTAEGQKRLLSFKSHVGVPALAQATTNFRQLEMPLPDISNQRKIAAVLSALDAKIECNYRINAELEAMAKTLYDYWFVQFDFPDANGKPYKSSGGKMVYNTALKREIPAGWRDGSLWDIARYFNGLPMQKHRPKGSEFLPVIKIREMGEGVSASTEKADPDLPRAAIIDDGDVLFSWSATLDVKIWSRGKGALNQHIFKVTSDEHPKTFYYFELLAYLSHFKMMAEKRKTTMGHITQDHLKQSRICIPPPEIVARAHAQIDPMLKLHLVREKENQQLAQLRDWLLPMLMNGQVTVT